MTREQAFREALDALVAECVCMDPKGAYAARTRVLALYAERQGEVYEVSEWEYPDGRSFLAVIFPKERYENGDFVRVTKVEEAK